MKMKKGLKKLLILLLVIAISFGAGAIYFLDYNHADEIAIKALQSNNEIEVIENKDYISFRPLSDHVSTAIIIYPGGKVESKAYAPLCSKLASAGYYVAIGKMPLNCSLFGIRKANKVLEDTNYENYYIAGHSLGGWVASYYISKNTKMFKGLILMSSFSTNDLKNTNLKVLSIYGSEDKIVNPDTQNKYKDNLPNDYIEVVIAGGCHSQFGSYGKQKKDGEASISDEAFITQCVLAITAFTIVS